MTEKPPKPPKRPPIRLRDKHQDEVRQKIQVSQLINRLQKYVAGELTDDDVTPGRLEAIKILLRKALPDLSSVEMSGNGQGITLIIKDLTGHKGA